MHVCMFKTYANRSMIGAQFLLAIKARSSRRALSICLRYSVSTIGIAIDSEDES
ncbi:hypothetical protein Hanom_Chr17g01546521 [Helianthus anomalus]